jgi:hypothetical protein
MKVRIGNAWEFMGDIVEANRRRGIITVDDAWWYQNR